MIRRTTLAVTLSLLLLSFPTVSFAIDPAIVAFDPEPVEIPASLSKKEAKTAVVRAFVIRSWTITNVAEDGNVIDAELPVRQHVGRVRAQIREENVTFHYRKSDNVDHGWIRKKGVQTSKANTEIRTVFAQERRNQSDEEAVHRNYLSWVEKVARTLEGTFRLQTMKVSD